MKEKAARRGKSAFLLVKVTFLTAGRHATVIDSGGHFIFVNKEQQQIFETGTRFVIFVWRSILGVMKW
jgi:hypothetical protein